VYTGMCDFFASLGRLSIHPCGFACCNPNPGHGGVMDRMDCQFLMALCTWVHYNTFVKLATVSVPKLTYMYSLLSEQEKKDFLLSISTGKTKLSLGDYD
jgi:hypothetical protein